MTNAYYNATGNPLTLSRGTSSLLRNEFAAIQTGLALLPIPTALAGDQQSYAVDSGSVNAVVIPLPANTTALTDGQKVVFKIANSVTGASTIKVGTFTVPLIRPDGTATQSGDLVAGQIVDCRYSLSQASFQIQNIGVATASLAAASAAAAATSAAAAAASAASTSGVKFNNNGLSINANITISLSNLGSWGIFSSSGWTATLPAVASASNGSTWTQVGGVAGGILKANASESIYYNGNPVNSFFIEPGEIATVACNGSSAWFVTSNGMSSTAIANAIPGRNKIINGDMRVAQRGQSFTLSTTLAYGSLDRWIASGGTSGGFCNQNFQPNLAYLAGGNQAFMQLGRLSGSTSTGTLQVITALESANSIPLAGKTVCLSFYVATGANFSASGITVNLNTGTGIDQPSSSIGVWTGVAVPIAQSVPLTQGQGVTRYSFTATLANNISQVGVYIAYIPTGTAGANDYILLTGVQLEVVPSLTSPPTQFEILDYGVELGICKRYFEMSYDIGTAPGTATTSAMSETYISGPSGFNAALVQAPFKVNKRIAPTMTYYSPATGAAGKIRDAVNNVDITATPSINGTTSASASGVMSIANNYINMQMHWTASSEL